MFSNATSRIFLTFSGLILLSFIFLSYLFGRSYIQQVETQILDNLSSRIEAYSLKNEDQLRQGILPKDSLFSLITFDHETLKNFLPPDGSLVTICPEKEPPSYCAINKIEGSPYWLLLRVESPSWAHFFYQALREIFFGLSVLLLICFGLAWGLARFLMSPLRRFAKASDLLSKGNYHQIRLPNERQDEVGQLARSFSQMAKEIKAREIQIAETGVKLAHSARLASLGQLGAGVAHEVKNPLMALSGHAKLLVESSKDPDTRETAELIARESERCNQILQQMLRFSRNDPHEKKSFLINEVIQSTALLIKAEAKKRGIEIELKSKSDGVANANPQQIQQVLLNLVLNALQASERGSKVILESLDESDETILIAVEDSGTGIPQAIQEKIFQAFYTTKDKKEGSGLGLSLAVQFIEDQGGQISVQSTEGKGSRFEIRLPREA